ncbi:MAG: hypothetical protein KAJ01_01100, partial [Candidatus Hydrogenedentes bacterium]|nr:hypothetical protein [Candidatus Hydrogenedentota bacterium]
MRKSRSILLSLLLACTAGTAVLALGGRSASTVVGEAFGRPVTEKEFAYHYKTAVFFTRTRKPSRSDEETRVEAWQNLVFRQGAGRLNITVSRKELQEQLNRLFSEKDVVRGSREYRELIRTQF